MNTGIDIGYSHTKVVGDGGLAMRFPTLSGNVERTRFTLNGRDDGVTILEIPGDGQHVVGEAALRLSRFKPRREDRNWIESAAYLRYYLAALTELTTANYAEVQLVTGLPVTYFAQDKAKLSDRLSGDFRVQREGRNWQKFTVSQVVVLPQPFGTLLKEALDNRGRIVNQRLATGRAGVIDIGGKTTGYLSVDNLAEIPPETGSIDVGCWEALTLIRDAVNTEYPGLDLEDHEIASVVANDASVSYYGELQDVSEIVGNALEPLAERVIAEATTLWNGGARLDTILVTGGGARLVGPAICEKFPQAEIVMDAAFANATGYYRFAQRQYAQ
jgi:plasmid segregation protein ParM